MAKMAGTFLTYLGTNLPDVLGFVDTLVNAFRSIAGIGLGIAAAFAAIASPWTGGGFKDPFSAYGSAKAKFDETTPVSKLAKMPGLDGWERRLKVAGGIGSDIEASITGTKTGRFPMLDGALGKIEGFMKAFNPEGTAATLKYLESIAKDSATVARAAEETQKNTSDTVDRLTDFFARGAEAQLRSAHRSLARQGM
jgi:hypothetical protein